MESALSVFLPCYNEQENILPTVTKVKSVLQKTVKNWEILIIDDGSRDKSPQIADRVAKSDKRIRVIHHPVNQGYGGALQSGMYNSKYPWIAFTDIDGQFDFSEITRLFARQKETQADLVIGYYLKREVPFATILTSKIWELIVFLLFGLHVRDIDCGFKLFSKKIIETIPRLESRRGAFISSEFLVKARRCGFKIVEIGVHHYPRVSGKATGRRLNVILKSFVDLFRLWAKMSFSFSFS